MHTTVLTKMMAFSCLYINEFPHKCHMRQLQCLLDRNAGCIETIYFRQCCFKSVDKVLKNTLK